MSRSENKVLSSRSYSDKNICCRCLHFSRPSCKTRFGHLEFSQEIKVWRSKKKSCLALVLYTWKAYVRVVCSSVFVRIQFGQFRVQQIQCDLASRIFNAVWLEFHNLKYNVCKRQMCRRQEWRGHLTGRLQIVAKALVLNIFEFRLTDKCVKA